jgi:hypothetical protein
MDWLDCALVGTLGSGVAVGGPSSSVADACDLRLGRPRTGLGFGAALGAGAAELDGAAGTVDDSAALAGGGGGPASRGDWVIGTALASRGDGAFGRDLLASGNGMGVAAGLDCFREASCGSTGSDVELTSGVAVPATALSLVLPLGGGLVASCCPVSWFWGAGSLAGDGGGGCAWGGAVFGASADIVVGAGVAEIRPALCDDPEGPSGRRLTSLGPSLGRKPAFLLSMLIVPTLGGVLLCGGEVLEGESQGPAAAERGNSPGGSSRASEGADLGRPVL